VQRVPSFARGLARCGDYLFVGNSRVRAQHTFSDLGVAQHKDAFCGISILHLPTRA
jgi:hypothetical protein